MLEEDELSFIFVSDLWVVPDGDAINLSLHPRASVDVAVRLGQLATAVSDAELERADVDVAARSDFSAGTVSQALAPLALVAGAGPKIR